MDTLHSPRLLPGEKAEPDGQTDKEGQGEITGNKGRGEREEEKQQAPCGNKRDRRGRKSRRLMKKGRTVWCSESRVMEEG